MDGAVVLAKARQNVYALGAYLCASMVVSRAAGYLLASEVSEDSVWFIVGAVFLACGVTPVVDRWYPLSISSSRKIHIPSIIEQELRQSDSVSKREETPRSQVGAAESTQVDDIPSKWWQDEEVVLTSEEESAVQALMESHFGESAGPRSQLVNVVVNNDWRAAAVKALKARQFNVSETRILVDQMLQWRQDMKVDQVLEEPLETATLRNIRSCLFDGFSGICKQGNPIYILLGGQMDLAKCKRLVGVETILRYHVQVMEYCNRVYYKSISEKVGRTTTKVTLLLDLQGFGGHNVKSDFWEVMNALSNIDSNYYYEFLAKVLIVNAGLFFRIFWKTASPMLAPDTKKKFHVLSKLSQLEEHIPAHQLPVRFGGDVPDEGSFCTEMNPWTHMYQEFDQYVVKCATVRKEAM